MVADVPANADKPLVRWFPQIVEIDLGMVSSGDREVCQPLINALVSSIPG